MNLKNVSLGKLYILPKIHKRLFDVPGRPVISNCGVATKKVPEFLDCHLKPTMQQDKYYIRDSEDFFPNIRKFASIPFLVTADVMGLYLSIPHSLGLSAPKSDLENRKEKQIPTSHLLKMAEFVQGNNYFEFLDKVY